MDARHVTDIFLERGLITTETAEQLVQLSETEHKPIEQAILDAQIVDESGF